MAKRLNPQIRADANAFMLLDETRAEMDARLTELENLSDSLGFNIVKARNAGDVDGFALMEKLYDFVDREIMRLQAVKTRLFGMQRELLNEIVKLEPTIVDDTDETADQQNKPAIERAG